MERPPWTLEGRRWIYRKRFLLHHLDDHVVRGDGQQEDAQEVVDADQRTAHQVEDVVVDGAGFQKVGSKEGECKEEDSERPLLGIGQSNSVSCQAFPPWRDINHFLDKAEL